MTKKNHRPTLVQAGKQGGEVEEKPKRKDTPIPPSPIILSQHDPEEERRKRAMTRAAIISNANVRTISHILQNGTRMAEHPHINFEAHNVLLTKMQNAAERRDEWVFLETLATYLEQASSRIPGAGRKEDVPVMIDLLKLLIGEFADDDGFIEVANCIIRAARAPVDRF